MASELPPIGHTPPKIPGDVKQEFVIRLDMTGIVRGRELNKETDECVGYLRRMDKNETGLKGVGYSVSEEVPDRKTSFTTDEFRNSILSSSVKRGEGEALTGEKHDGPLKNPLKNGPPKNPPKRRG